MSRPNAFVGWRSRGAIFAVVWPKGFPHHQAIYWFCKRYRHPCQWAHGAVLLLLPQTSQGCTMTSLSLEATNIQPSKMLLLPVCVCAGKFQIVWHTSCLCSEKNLVCWFAIIAHHHYDTIGILNGTPLVCAYDLLGWGPLGEHHNTWKPRGV